MLLATIVQLIIKLSVLLNTVKKLQNSIQFYVLTITNKQHSNATITVMPHPLRLVEGAWGVIGDLNRAIV